MHMRTCICLCIHVHRLQRAPLADRRTSEAWQHLASCAGLPCPPSSPHSLAEKRHKPPRPRNTSSPRVPSSTQPPPTPHPSTRRTHSTHSQPPLPFHAGAGKQQPPSMHVRTGQGRHLLNLSPIDANARTPAHDLGGINKVLERRVVHRGEGAREGALLLLRAVLAALCPCRSYVTTPRHATRRRSVGSAVAARHPHAGKPGARQRMPAETSQGGG